MKFKAELRASPFTTTGCELLVKLNFKNKDFGYTKHIHLEELMNKSIVDLIFDNAKRDFKNMIEQEYGKS